MNTSSAGIHLIQSFESCRLTAYRDSTGILTIGYGHTDAVHEGLTCTYDQALQWLAVDLRAAERAINEHVCVALTQNQFDALSSFAFNVGCGAFEESTLLRLLNDRQYGQAADQFPLWNRAGGVVLDDLVRRRSAEQALFLEPA